MASIKIKEPPPKGPGPGPIDPDLAEMTAAFQIYDITDTDKRVWTASQKAKKAAVKFSELKDDPHEIPLNIDSVVDLWVCGFKWDEPAKSKAFNMLALAARDKRYVPPPPGAAK